jgi:hypothetical protein
MIGFFNHVAKNQNSLDFKRSSTLKQSHNESGGSTNIRPEISLDIHGQRLKEKMKKNIRKS